MNRLDDGLDDGIEICLHVGIPEAQDTIASRSQETIAPSIIGFAFDMLTSI